MHFRQPLITELLCWSLLGIIALIKTVKFTNTDLPNYTTALIANNWIGQRIDEPSVVLPAWCAHKDWKMKSRELILPIYQEL
jgi:hypothetical protein